jgi:hypothetical protein
MANAVASLSRPQVRIGAASLLTSLGLGAYAMMSHLGQAAWASTYGPICGHAAGQPHCAACYAALATAGLGAGLLLTRRASRTA